MVISFVSRVRGEFLREEVDAHGFHRGLVAHEAEGIGDHPVVVEDEVGDFGKPDPEGVMGPDQLPVVSLDVHEGVVRGGEHTSGLCSACSTPRSS